MLGTLLFLSSCGAKKAAVSTPPTVPEPVVPAWHTCAIQGARITVEDANGRMNATANMQVVRDSMCIISVTAMLGLEVVRIEATPTQVTAIDKIHGRYATATYAEINHKTRPEINWDILQQLCSAELPTGNKKARLHYIFDGTEAIDLIVEYPERRIDVPVRMNAARLDNYTQVDISKWL